MIFKVLTHNYSEEYEKIYIEEYNSVKIDLVPKTQTNEMFEIRFRFDMGDRYLNIFAKIRYDGNWKTGFTEDQLDEAKNTIMRRISNALDSRNGYIDVNNVMDKIISTSIIVPINGKTPRIPSNSLSYFIFEGDMKYE